METRKKKKNKNFRTRILSCASRSGNIGIATILYIYHDRASRARAKSTRSRQTSPFSSSLNIFTFISWLKLSRKYNNFLEICSVFGEFKDDGILNCMYTKRHAPRIQKYCDINFEFITELAYMFHIFCCLYKQVFITLQCYSL